ncbi:hypothetical protein HK102_003338 [Quaeritorhiza haematococci]|nr:hypothetical protein HK102_003338 [Quaeritorhiza haematococci]
MQNLLQGTTDHRTNDTDVFEKATLRLKLAAFDVYQKLEGLEDATESVKSEELLDKTGSNGMEHGRESMETKNGSEIHAVEEMEGDFPPSIHKFLGAGQRKMISLATSLYASGDPHTAFLTLLTVLERILGDIIYTVSRKKKKKRACVPFLMRDLLLDEALLDVLGPDLIFILRVLVGPPTGMNLRNVLWHGFPYGQTCASNELTYHVDLTSHAPDAQSDDADTLKECEGVDGSRSHYPVLLERSVRSYFHFTKVLLFTVVHKAMGELADCLVSDRESNAALDASSSSSVDSKAFPDGRHEAEARTRVVGEAGGQVDADELNLRGESLMCRRTVRLTEYYEEMLMDEERKAETVVEAFDGDVGEISGRQMFTTESSFRNVHSDVVFGSTSMFQFFVPLSSPLTYRGPLPWTFNGDAQGLNLK